jgi:hypothetical protein
MLHRESLPALEAIGTLLADPAPHPVLP